LRRSRRNHLSRPPVPAASHDAPARLNMALVRAFGDSDAREGFDQPSGPAPLRLQRPALDRRPRIWDRSHSRFSTIERVQIGEMGGFLHERPLPDDDLQYKLRQGLHSQTTSITRARDEPCGANGRRLNFPLREAPGWPIVTPSTGPDHAQVENSRRSADGPCSAGSRHRPRNMKGHGPWPPTNTWRLGPTAFQFFLFFFLGRERKR